jgi:TRAP-type mannitol/chloroaromatic compound transport system substrate-binding protein
MERGVVDGVEWASPANDMSLGFQSVAKYYYMPSLHEPATIVELNVNKSVWDKLEPYLQEIIENSAIVVTWKWRAKWNYLDGLALKEAQEKHGVKVMRTPDDVLQKTIETWDKMAAEESAKNPFFKKVYESQRAYASIVVPTRRALWPEYSFLADHYWKK